MVSIWMGLLPTACFPLNLNQKVRIFYYLLHGIYQIDWSPNPEPLSLIANNKELPQCFL